MKTTIIIPVYNVERYLRQCLDSVLAQTVARWDCVCVDDGSTDGSSAILAEYAARDSRFVVLSKTNGGMASARNLGLAWAIEQSDSDTLAFLDSDDWLDPRFLEILQIGLGKEGTVACAGVKIVYDDSAAPIEGDVKWQMLNAKEYWLSDELVNSVCTKLFPKSAFENARFPEGMVHEDEFVTYRRVFEAKSIMKTSAKLYNYRMRPSSTVHRWTEKRLDHLTALKEQLSYFDELGDEDLVLHTRYELAKSLPREIEGLSRHRGGAEKIKKLQNELRVLMRVMPLSRMQRLRLLITQYPIFMRVLRPLAALRYRIKEVIR